MPSDSISDAEWSVLQALWEGYPVTAEEIVRRLRGRRAWRKTGWHERTVKTFLHRLVRKGVLAFEKDGKRYLYSPRLSRQACVREASRSFLDRVFGGAAAPAILHLVEEAKLPRSEIERLRKLLERGKEAKEGPP